MQTAPICELEDSLMEGLLSFLLLLAAVRREDSSCWNKLVSVIHEHFPQLLNSVSKQSFSSIVVEKWEWSFSVRSDNIVL